MFGFTKASIVQIIFQLVFTLTAIVFNTTS